MTTPTALLAEARLQAEAPASTTTGRTIFIARARTLLPQLAAAYVAYHAKVRERAVIEAPLHPTDRLEYTCHLCGGTWLDNESETHVVVDCPARPMEPSDA